MSCTPGATEEIKERFHRITKTYYISDVDTIFGGGGVKYNIYDPNYKLLIKP